MASYTQFLFNDPGGQPVAGNGTDDAEDHCGQIHGRLEKCVKRGAEKQCTGLCDNNFISFVQSGCQLCGNQSAQQVECVCNCSRTITTYAAITLKINEITVFSRYIERPKKL